MYTTIFMILHLYTSISIIYVHAIVSVLKHLFTTISMVRYDHSTFSMAMLVYTTVFAFTCLYCNLIVKHVHTRISRIMMFILQHDMHTTIYIVKYVYTTFFIVGHVYTLSLYMLHYNLNGKAHTTISVYTCIVYYIYLYCYACAYYETSL